MTAPTWSGVVLLLRGCSGVGVHIFAGAIHRLVIAGVALVGRGIVGRGASAVIR